MAQEESSSADVTELYLNLLKKTLTGSIYENNDTVLGQWNRGHGGWKNRLATGIGVAASSVGLEVVSKHPYDPSLRENGRDRPARADSMIGLRRMDNIHYCVDEVLKNEVPGDFIETGVWQGGATIFMRALLRVRGDRSRKVWVADSFEGLPAPDRQRYPADSGDMHHRFTALQVGVDQVKHNFSRYDMLDDRVVFLVGWFKDTLHTAPIDELAILRLDGDMYESTQQSIEALYPKLSPGGYCIVDDYGGIPACRRAITDYRSTHEILDEIVDIDGSGIYWQKSKP